MLISSLIKRFEYRSEFHSHEYKPEGEFQANKIEA